MPDCNGADSEPPTAPNVTNTGRVVQQLARAWRRNYAAVGRSRGRHYVERVRVTRGARLYQARVHMYIGLDVLAGLAGVAGNGRGVGWRAAAGRRRQALAAAHCLRPLSARAAVLCFHRNTIRP